MTSDTEREKVQVEAYAGYKAGETPRRVIMNGRNYEVGMLVYRKKITRLDTYEVEDHFLVDLKEYGPVQLVYKPRVGEWEMEKIEPEKRFADMI
jgi:hypothetical protein